MDVLLLLLLIVGAVLVAGEVGRRTRRRREERERAEAVEAVRRVTDEDVTRFGEELQLLDSDMLLTNLDEPMRQDYQRALDSYEHAKSTLAQMSDPEDVRHVTEALEDGRYAAACVLARRDGRALPVRRPPCFFNPTHGPSTTDLEWAPPGGVPRQVPVCAADADRVSQGAEPDIRTVPDGYRRVPYWQAGPAYSPWVGGYFGAYAASSLLPSMLLLTFLSPGWDGSAVAGAEQDFGAGEGSGDGGGGSDGAGDAGSDAGGDAGGGDGGGFDFGGDSGGGFDFGGGDFGGF